MKVTNIFSLSVIHFFLQMNGYAIGMGGEAHRNSNSHPFKRN